MKAFLYKAKLLIIIYSTSAFLLTLASAAFIKQYYLSQKILPCLSDSYIVGATTSYDIEEERSIKNSDVLSYLNSIEDNYIYIRNLSNSRGRAVVFSENSGFSLPIISGRLFQKEDFTNHSNTIIISEELEEDCVKKASKLYYIYNNKYFEVIGIYQGVLGEDIEEADYYINLQAEYMHDGYAYGEYLIDVGDKSQYECNKMEEYIEGINSDVEMQHASGLGRDSMTLSDVVSNASGMILIIFISALLVLMNSISVSSQWILARKKDIAVRKLLGASDENIRRWVIKQYIGLICGSFILGLLLASIIIKNSRKIVAVPTIYLLFGEYLDLRVTIIAFLILLIEGLAVLFITLNFYSKKHIVSNVR